MPTEGIKENTAILYLFFIFSVVFFSFFCTIIATAVAISVTAAGTLVLFYFYYCKNNCRN